MTDSYTPQTLPKNRNPLLKFSCCETKFLMQEIYVFLKNQSALKTKKKVANLFIYTFFCHTHTHNARKKSSVSTGSANSIFQSISVCICVCVCVLMKSPEIVEKHESNVSDMNYGIFQRDGRRAEGGRFWKLLADIENWSIEHYESPMNYASVNHARTKAKANKEERGGG